MALRWIEPRPDAESVIRAAADTAVACLQSAIEARGQALWAVSGGSSPKPLYQAVAAQPLEWDRVTILLVDERWVPEGHARSNTSFIKSTLMQGPASAAQFVPMVTADPAPAVAAPAVSAAYEAVGWPADLITLGMGPDGHTASLFPDAAGLEEAFDPSAPPVVALTAKKSAVTGEEVARITLSAAGIRAAGQVMLFIGGDEKKAVLTRELARADAGETPLPVARLLTSVPQGADIFWTG